MTPKERGLKFYASVAVAILVLLLTQAAFSLVSGNNDKAVLSVVLILPMILIFGGLAYGVGFFMTRLNDKSAASSENAEEIQKPASINENSNHGLHRRPYIDAKGSALIAVAILIVGIAWLSVTEISAARRQAAELEVQRQAAELEAQRQAAELEAQQQAAAIEKECTKRILPKLTLSDVPIADELIALCVKAGGVQNSK